MSAPGPREPPLLAAFRAGSILSGQSDKQLKERQAAQQSSRRNACDDESHQAETASSSKQPTGRKKTSPLSRILRIRLDAASSLLSGVDGWQDLSERLQIASEDDLHALTAEASLVCLQSMKREQDRSSGDKRLSNDEQPLGARDRKSFTTLLSLASQWGFGPALLAYDATFAAMTVGYQNGPKLEDVESQDKRRDQARSDFAAAREGLSRIFALAYSLFESETDNTGPNISPFDIDFILTAQQPMSGHLLASAIRLAMGPDPTHPDSVPPQNDKGKQRPPPKSIHQSRQLLSLLLRELPASSLLPMLSSVTATTSTPDSQQPQTPPFVKRFANRVLSAQLLRREGVSSLISTVMGIASEGGPSSSSGAAEVSSTRKLDRLVRLLVTPPPGLPQEQFLAQHILPSLLYFLVGDGQDAAMATAAQSTQAREAFASVAAYTFHHLLSKHEPLLQDTLRPLIWDSLLKQPPLKHEEKTSECQVISDATNVQKAIAVVELLVLYSPSYAPEWVRWVVSPISTRLWDLLETVESHDDSLATASKVSEVNLASKAKSRKVKKTRDQLAGILRRWLQSEETTTVLSFLKSLQRGATQTTGQSHATVHFQLQEDGLPFLAYGTPRNRTADNVDADQIMAQLSSGISHTALDDTSSTDDQENMKKSLQLMATLQGGTAQLRPSPTLVCKMLHSAQRSDVAALLLPQLLEEYIAVKSQSDSRTGTTSNSNLTGRLLPSLQLIVAILDAFGEDIVKKDPDQALRFVNICLGGSGGGTESKQHSNQVAVQNNSDEDIPFISAGAQKESSSAMGGLLNVSNESSPEAHNDHDAEVPADTDAVDEEVARMAIDVLLSVLESNPTMSTHTTPLLAVIAHKLSRAALSASEDKDLRRVVKEARVVLLARSEGHKKNQDDDEIPTIGKPSTQAQAQKEVTDQYKEALKLLQDPIVPVRAHGLDILKDIVALCVPTSSNNNSSTYTSSAVEKQKAAKSLLPSITNLLLGAVEDEESYLYLSAIRGLKQVMLCGEPWLSKLTSMYAGARSTSKDSKPLSRSEVDKCLRIGEALLDAVQTLGEAGSIYADSILPPLLRGLRDAQLPTTLRSSILSLLGTCVEAFPAAFAHARSGDLASELAEACTQILTLESVARPNDSTHGVLREQQDGLHHDEADEQDEDEAMDMSPEELKRRLNYAPGADDSTGTETSFPQLRRGALLLLNLLVGGATAQLEVELESQRDQDQFEAEHGALQALRLPGGGVLPRLSSSSSSAAGSGQQMQRLGMDSLLFSPSAASGVRRVLRHVRDNDTDALVRHQAGEGLEAVDGFELALVRLGLHA